MTQATVFDHVDPSQFSPLGKTTDYRADYAPELLFPIPRQIKRDELGLIEGKLPFVGEDIWNAYEVSWLNPKGKPMVALATFRVPAHSPNLIESKSLKLYLNSFNQTQFADVAAVTQTLTQDLSQAAGVTVGVEVQALTAQPQVNVAYPQGILLDTLDITCDTYQPKPDFLHTVHTSTTENETIKVEETLYSHLLKSNCLVTGQPDWAMVVIRYRGKPIDHANLLRYLVSFRGHNEFHEQCVERIWTDIHQHCQPEALAVYARYTRRGGLDINPFRSCGEFTAPENVHEVRQ